MTAAEVAAIELSAVSKQYGALRPLRIENLTVQRGAQIALMGLDQPAAEIFVNLVTGASLPDTGVIRVFGRPTAEIVDSSDWLSTLDRFGIVSDRAALLEPLSIVQNLSLPFTLEIEPPPPSIRRQATALADEVGLPEATWDQPIATLQAAGRLRVRIARALALDPSILLLEHPSATLPREDITTVARDVRAILVHRGVAAISLTMDRDFASAVSDRVLTLEAAGGRVVEDRPGKIRP